MAKVKKFNKYLSSELVLGTGDTPTLSVMYEHYKEAEVKEVKFLCNSNTMDNEQKLNFLTAVKKSCDSNTDFAMYKLKQRQTTEQIVSTYQAETEAETEADSLFIG